MLRAGSGSDPPVSFAPVALWVLSPFVGLGVAESVSRHCSALTRAMLRSLILVVTACSLAIFWSAASAPPGSEAAFLFLAVPAGSWLLVLTAAPAAVLATGRWSRIRRIGWLVRATAVAVLLGSLGIVSVLGLLLLDHNRETTLPAPTGPLAVGRTTYVWNDTHADVPAPRPGIPRTLVAWVWYPAAPRRPGQACGDYLPAPLRTALERERGVLLTQFATRDLARVRTHSLVDADESPRQPAYPVVLMRVGLAALTTDYTSLAEDLASHGYVVVGVDASYRSFVVVLPDGSVIARAP
jgi:hypothetical protein